MVQIRRFRISACVAVAIASGLATSYSAHAHHSFAMFDMSQTLALDGTIKEFQFTNPHVWIKLMVRDPKSGQTVEYAIEGGSPNNLLRAGWKRDSVKAGDKVVVRIHPLRNGGAGGSLIGVDIDGVTVGAKQ